jgi:diketogulonate reductase-like aldo/keto reductase
MEERRVGPVVVLGTWNTFGDDQKLAREVVDAALAAGSRCFDSSPMYGGAERAVAAALAGRRDQATVLTKIWTSSPEEARHQLADQLESFGHVDVEQVHNLVAWERHLPWLEAECGGGRIGKLGVTHYSPSAFDDLERALRTRRFDTLAAELGVAVIVMRPFGRGALLAREPAPEELCPLAEFGVRTWAQALLKWALSDERVDLVIPATRRRAERAAENAAAGEPPWLGREERAYVEGLVQ